MPTPLATVDALLTLDATKTLSRAEQAIAETERSLDENPGVHGANEARQIIANYHGQKRGNKPGSGLPAATTALQSIKSALLKPYTAAPATPAASLTPAAPVAPAAPVVAKLEPHIALFKFRQLTGKDRAAFFAAHCDELQQAVKVTSGLDRTIASMEINAAMKGGTK